MTNPLLTKIKSDAEAKAAAIVTEAKEAVAKIQADTAAKVAELETAAATQLEKRQQHAELVALAQSEQAGKLALQAAKREHIDALFSAVFAELGAMTEAEYKAFVTALAGDVLPESLTGVSVVRYPATHQEITKEILTTLKITAAEMKADKDITVGFVAETADGVYDVTLDRIFGERRTQLEIEVAASLA